MERETFEYLTKKLTQKFGNSFHITGKEPVGGGCISQSFMLKTSSGSFFLKMNHDAADNLFIREAECLKELKLSAGKQLVIPEVILAEDGDCDMPGFIVLEFLETGHLPGQEESLGRGLAFLHRYQDRQFGFYHSNFCGSTPQKNDWCDNWRDFFINNRLLYLLELVDSHRKLGVGEKKIYEALAGKLADWLPASAKVSLIHGDLWSGNFLYTNKGPALIDPASYYADREMELGMMTLFGGFSDRIWNAYNDTLPLESGWEERLPVYQLYHILNHYLLFGGSYGQQALRIAGNFIR